MNAEIGKKSFQKKKGKGDNPKLVKKKVGENNG